METRKRNELLVLYNEKYREKEEKNMIITKEIVDKLKPGDIVQYHEEDLGPYWGFFYWSHTMLYIGDDTLLHAGAPVQTSDIYDYFTHHPKVTNFVALRVKNASQTQVDGAVAFAKSKLDKPYELWSMYHFTKQLDPPPGSPGYGYYCTELVWASYFSQGIDIELPPGIGLVNPMEIYMNPALSIVYITSRWKVRMPWLRLY